MDMTSPAYGIGSVLEHASERLQPVAAVILAIGLLTAILTDGSVSPLVTKALLATMVLPTVVLALGLTRPTKSSMASAR
jgi:hypothetical protein